MNSEAHWLAEAWNKSHRTSSLGFECGFETQAAMASLAPIIERALKLVEQHDAPHFTAMRNSMPKILTHSIPGYNARYSRQLHLCELHAPFVAHPSTTTAKIALALVHEGFHARVHSRRLYERGLDRLREERLAARKELAFARTLQGEEQLIANAKRRLAEVNVVYSRESQMRRDFLRAANAGVPFWIVKLLARMKGVEIKASDKLDPYDVM